MANTDKQDKIDALNAAIDAVRALGEGYTKMVYALEDDLYALQQDVLAEKKQEIEHEEHLYMMECFTVCEEAKQNEKRIKTELKITHIKLARMHNSGVWSGAGHDAALEQIVKLTMALSQVWAKYDRMMFGE